MPGLMDILGGDIVATVGKVVTDLVTTDKERLQLGLEDKKLDLQGDTEQNEINKAEAQTGKFWVAGWRPGIGWVGVVALACAYIPKCVMLTGIWSYQAILVVSTWKAGTPMPGLPTFPDLGITDLIGILMPMLGIGYMRHKEKIAGVASTGIPVAASNPGQQEAP